MGKFKKGDISNPIGGLPIGQDLKEARKLTRLEFEKMINKYLFMSVNEIQDRIKHQEKYGIPMIEALILSGLALAYKEGDIKRLDFFLDRTIGRVVMKHHVVTEVDESSRVAPVQLTESEKLEMIEAYKKRVLANMKGGAIDVSPISREDQSSVQESDQG